MADLGYIALVWSGTVGVTFLAWSIVHFNGKTICGTIDLASSIFPVDGEVNFAQKNWLTVATEGEILILGITPIAIASLVSTSRGNCYSSINSFLIAEAMIIGLFLLIPRQQQTKLNFWDERFYRQYWSVFAIAIIWCLAFAVWGVLALNPQEYMGVDRLLVNGNGDLWFYIRRYAAYTLDNLSFNHEPACFYLQLSPKKLSSFIGSIIVYLTPNTVLGITLFQGLLGCTLFLSLFGNWYNFTYAGKRLSNGGTIAAIAWALFSPLIFSLLITSHLSNTLFIAVFALSITAIRRICLNSDLYPLYAKSINLFCFIICIFSFYLVILPVALLFYLAAMVIYSRESYQTVNRAIVSLSKIMLVAGMSILLCCIIFNRQANLTEVSDNINVLRTHGTNIVPLNPWSLLQERPKPMPIIKDFGVWFNIVVGIIFSGWVLSQIHQHLHNLPRLKGKASNSILAKDLIAAELIIIAYMFHLLAYIPLESTYRLGKFASSIIYPLAIFSILPTVFWIRDRDLAAISELMRLSKMPEAAAVKDTEINWQDMI